MAPSHRLTICKFEGTFAVYRLPVGSPVPAFVSDDGFCSVTRTADELSVVCPESAVPEGARCERDWVGFRIVGMIPFSETGVLAALVLPLADAGVSVFALSTFDTDYVFVKSADEERSRVAWLSAGHACEDGP
jgi:hypothetical protein